jgi:hypothetical protein
MLPVASWATRSSGSTRPSGPRSRPACRDGPVGLHVHGDDVVAAGVADDEQLALEQPAERVGLVLDDAVGRVVLAEDVGRAAVVAVGLGADGVLGELLVVGARGRVAAVLDELAAGRVGVAVVAAVDDAVEVVVLGLVDGLMPGSGCC